MSFLLKHSSLYKKCLHDKNIYHVKGCNFYVLRYDIWEFLYVYKEKRWNFCDYALYEMYHVQLCNAGPVSVL